jgi:hypothetical protein
MKPISSRCFALLLAVAFPAMATVTVSFPSLTYSDLGPPGKDRDDVKNELATYLHVLDAKYLKASDNLWVEVVDVDLAGDRVPGRHDVRVARGKSDIPTIVVRYKLERDGKTLAGEDTLSNATYQQSTMTLQASSTPYYYEKRMLEDWFRERFAR